MQSKDYWYSNYCTQPSKIAQLDAGMSVSEVHNTLGVDPSDVYLIDNKKRSVFAYHYRKKIKKMKLPEDDQYKAKHNENSLTKGEDWYTTETRKMYILFKNDKLATVTTDHANATWRPIDLSKTSSSPQITIEEKSSSESNISLSNKSSGSSGSSAKTNIGQLPEKKYLVIGEDDNISLFTGRIANPSHVINSDALNVANIVELNTSSSDYSGSVQRERTQTTSSSSGSSSGSDSGGKSKDGCSNCWGTF